MLSPVLALLLPALALLLPVLPVQADSSRQAADWTYTVRPQDTIWSISKDHLDARYPAHKLIHYNRLTNGTDLKVGTQIRIPVSWLRQQPEPAMVASVNGQVRVRRGQDSSLRPLQQGQPLHVGDEIFTDQGSVNIRFADGSTLRLNEFSQLRFNSLTRFGQSGMVDTRTRLSKGSLSTDVNPQRGSGARYEIATPSAVAAVRGTQFRLIVERDATRAEVTQGTVQLESGNRSVPVAAGQGTRIGAALIAREPVNLLSMPELAATPQTVEQLPWTLDWRPVSQASSYVAELYETNEAGARLRIINTESPGWQLDDLNNGSYLLAVRAVDAEGFQGLDSKLPFTVKLQSLPALLDAPRHQDQLQDTNPRFQWRIQREGDLSSLQIGRDPDFSQLLTQSPFTPGTYAQSSAPLTPGRYYWRVATVAGGTSISHSETRELRVLGELPKTNIIVVNYLQDRVRLFWKALDQTGNFLVQVAKDPQFTEILREEQVTGTNVSIQLPDKQTYYARVKGIGDEFHLSDFGAGREIALP